MPSNNFPKTRYQGSKYKLIPFLRDIFSGLDFNTVLDAFSGTCSVAYLLKTMNKTVYANDVLKFNSYIAKAFIENNDTIVGDKHIKDIMFYENEGYKSIIQDNFKDIYYLDEENIWLDKIVQNIENYSNEYEKCLLYWALFQACLIKRPYNLFHRKNLHIRTADVKRRFGNKATWDKDFSYSFKKFVAEANLAVIDNGKRNIALNIDVFDIDIKPDLVYIDTPYIPVKGSLTQYREFYHFLEGIVNYGIWESKIDISSKHKKLVSEYCVWEDKNKIDMAFGDLFDKFKESIIVVSYRDDGIPSIDRLQAMLKDLNKKTTVYREDYKYALSKRTTKEVVIVAE